MKEVVSLPMGPAQFDFANRCFLVGSAILLSMVGDREARKEVNPRIHHLIDGLGHDYQPEHIRDLLRDMSRLGMVATTGSESGEQRAESGEKGDGYGAHSEPKRQGEGGKQQ